MLETQYEQERVIAELHQGIAQQSDNLEELLGIVLWHIRIAFFILLLVFLFLIRSKRKRMVTTVVSFWYLVRKVVKR